MNTYVSFRLPLSLILVELVKVTRSVVEEDGLGRNVVENLWRLEVLDGLQESSLLPSIYHLDRLLSDGAEVDKKLHAETASEQGFVRGFAHFK